MLDLRALIRALEPFDVEAFLTERQPERTALVCSTMLEFDQLLLSSPGASLPPEAPLQSVPGCERILALMKPTPFQWRVKVWCARRLPVSLPHYALWWLASLPLRTAASHPVLRAPALPGGQR